MKTSVELKQERKAISDKIDGLTARAKAENRNLTEDETKEMRDLMASEVKFTSDIELALELEKREAAKASTAAATNLTTKSTPENREMANFSLGKLIREASSNRGVDGVTGFEKEMLQESEKEARSLGVTPSGIYLSNTLMSVKQSRSTMVAGTANLGGNFIPTEKLGFFDAFYAKTVLPSLGVEYLTGLSANTDLPGFGTGVTVGWETEVAANDETNPIVANRTLRPKRLGAFTPISKQLMTQTNGSVEGYVMNTFMKALASALEAACINGSGNAPTGLLGTANIGSVVLGTDGGAPTLAKILELVQTVASANAPTENLRWLINPKVESKLKQTPIVSGGGVGAMIMAYQNYYTGTPGVIDGKPVAVTSNVPSNLTKGTSSGICSAIIVGDFSNMVVGQFGGVDIIIDPYTSAKNATIDIVINQYVDMCIKQPTAFAAIVDALTT